MNVITYLNARKMGLSRYYTGVPCKRGHLSERSTCSRTCVECHKIHKKHYVQTGATKISSKKYYQKTKLIEPWKHLFRIAKDRARRKHFPFNLTVDFLKEIWPKNNMCPVFNLPFVYTKITHNPRAPSIDKFIPALGYVKGNVSIISLRANQLKGTESEPESLRQVANWMEGWLRRNQK